MIRIEYLKDSDLVAVTGGKSVVAISGNPQVAKAHGGSKGVPNLPQTAGK